MAITNKVEDLRTKENEFMAIIESIPYSKVDSYIDNNINDLQSAKTFLKKLTKIVLYLVKN